MKANTFKSFVLENTNPLPISGPPITLAQARKFLLDNGYYKLFNIQGGQKAIKVSYGSRKNVTLDQTIEFLQRRVNPTAVLKKSAYSYDIRLASDKFFIPFTTPVEINKKIKNLVNLILEKILN